MKYYIIAGEASGDLHGSNLIREIRKKDPGAVIRCWGGDMMQAAGGEVVKHYRDLAFMGFAEVISNIFTIMKNFRFCKKDILEFHPDVVVFIDYPGFNIRMAKFVKAHGYKTAYYISPQVWAWKEGRVRTLRKVIDRMIVILPFEKAFYRKWNLDAEYVGHPLIQVISEFREQQQNSTRSETPVKTIALLPGSRKQEINKKLPVMLSVCDFFPDYQFVIAQAPGLDDAFMQTFTAGHPNVQTVKGKTYDLLIRSEAALVTSGTATLETALLGIPEVVCYKGSALSYAIARRLIRVPYISLVNLIMNKEVVKELIQDDLNTENLKRELDLLLNNPEKKSQLEKDYRDLYGLLSKGGQASARAAEIIVESAK